MDSREGHRTRPVGAPVAAAPRMAHSILHVDGHREGSETTKGRDANASRPFVSTIPAASYSPAGSPPKYHRRWRTLLLCSGWEEVCPLRYGHRKGCADTITCLQTCRAGGRRGPESYIAARMIKSSPRPISTGLLNMLPCLHILPINQVVYLGPYPLKVVGHLILRRASRLDAFSGYLFQT